MIVSPDNAFTTVALPQLRIAASARDLRLEICEVRTADQLPASIKAAVKAGATGLTILETPILYGLRRQIADLAAELRLFAIYTSRDFVDAGGLISYAADRRQQSIILLPGPLHRAQTITPEDVIRMRGRAAYTEQQVQRLLRTQRRKLRSH